MRPLYRRLALVFVLAFSLAVSGVVLPPSDAVTAATVAPPTPAPGASNAFPGEDRTFIATLEFVNRYVNANMVYVSDMDQYGVTEHWVMNPASGMGDCEDYALTKLSLLQQLGFPYIGSARIRALVATTPKGQYGHAVLEVRMKTGTVILDNNFNQLMTREELEKNHGYRFFDW